MEIKLTFETPIKSEHYDCFQQAIETAAKIVNRSSFLAYTEAWNFIFEPFKYRSLVSDTIRADFSSMPIFLEKYHGIELQDIHCENFSEFISLVKEEVYSGKPIIAIADSFILPWDPYYHKSHGNHSFVITGINESQEKIHCVDIYYSNKTNLHINFEDYHGLSKDYIILNIANSEKIEVDWHEITQNAVDKLQGNNNGTNSFDNMRRFSQFLQGNLDINNEFDGYSNNLEKTPILNAIHSTVRGKIAFCNILEYFGNKCNLDELLSISQDLKLVQAKWNEIKSLLIKAYITSTYKGVNEKLSNKIIDVANFEENLALKLQTFTRKNKFGTLNRLVYNSKLSLQNKQKASTIIFVDISQYFNNIGISLDVDNTNKADINGFGQHFYMNSLSQSRILMHNNMQFNIVNVGSACNDNISCEGQKVDVCYTNISSIMLLGCSIYGAAKEEFYVEFDDGDEEEFSIMFSDWEDRKAGDESMALRCKTMIKTEESRYNINGDGFLFAHEYAFKSTRSIKCITLPYNPRVHIFAITLSVMMQA